MVVLKVLFSNDLRRISVEDGVGLNEVNQRIKQLFNLPLTYCGLNIVWTPKEGQNQIITTDKQWAELVASASETDNILRLEIQKSASSQPPIEPEESPLNSPSSILDRPDVRKHLETIIAETIQSKPFVDLIAQKLSVYLKDTEMKANAPIEKQELAVSETVPTVVLDSLKRSLLEKRVEEPVIPVIETKEEKKEEKQEDLPKVEEKPEDTFVVVQEIKEKAEGLATSPLVKSVLSFFKSFKKDEPKASANEKEIPEEKLEEMLKQLNDMGFTDREANLKALKFHNNYQEGLDAVVEDLLTQIQPQQEAEKEEDMIEEPLIQPQKKEEPVIVKEVPPKPQETDPNGIEGITAEDIERLMRHANISREAAIKALRSQLW